MSLEKDITPQHTSAKRTSNALLKNHFLGLKGRPNFPFTMALRDLENLEATTENKEDFYHYLLEDIVFSSIYATFYEKIFVTIKNDPDLAIGLVNSFAKNKEERERIISEQTEYHVNFVLNDGLCSGCSACEHHKDVAELLSRWQNGDVNFFVTLYLGMQSIQYSMEYLLYDVVPVDKQIISQLTQDNIMSFRQFIYNYVETHSK